MVVEAADFFPVVQMVPHCFFVSRATSDFIRSLESWRYFVLLGALALILESVAELPKRAFSQASSYCFYQTFLSWLLKKLECSFSVHRATRQSRSSYHSFEGLALQPLTSS